MFDVCVRFSVFVLSCVQVEALRRADHRPTSPTVCKMIKKLRNQPYAPKWEEYEKKRRPYTEKYCTVMAVLVEDLQTQPLNFTGFLFPTTPSVLQ
jgi:hypothetical protein